MKVVLLFAAALLSIGCAQSRNFEISVRNDTHKSLTVWLTKTAGPFEAGWKSPEDLAWQHLGANETFSGLTVPIGKTGYTGKLSGKFDPGCAAVMRVYIGISSYEEILAAGHDPSTRVDVPLEDGQNRFIAVDDGLSVALQRLAP